MKKVFIFLFAVIMAAAWADTEVLKFKDAVIEKDKTIAREKCGYTMQKSADGLNLHFFPCKRNNTSAFPYVGVSGKSLKVQDWRQYKYLAIKIKSEDYNVSPTAAIVISDKKGKSCQLQAWVRCNEVTDLILELDKIAGAGE